ncbi:phage tail assembly protein T [Psychrobacter sp.]|uniref:phage tail assembly protein T n=1 Tax=Psychrobacter sp. TaxID=56811 RepID=UPI003C7533F4
MDELRAWQAFDRVNPIGDYRMDLNFAMLFQKIAQWSGYCKELPSLKELLVIDPFPLTDEQRAIETAKADAARSQAYTQSLIATLKSRVKK